MKVLIALLALMLCFSLTACSNGNSIVVESKSSDVSAFSEVEEDQSLSKQVYRYFSSDEIVDEFFSAYNMVAEIPISADEINEGNIRTKALVYIDDLNLEIINAKSFLSISVGASGENEETKIFPVFRDSLKAMKSSITDDEIQSAWNGIHETGYVVENFEFNGITISYIPSRKLSQGMSTSRVDMNIPLE